MKLAFIGGTGRCGTSITRKLLGTSSNVAVLPFEHRILIDPDAPIDFLNSMDIYRDPFKVDLAIKRMISHLESLDNSSLPKSTLDYFLRKSKLNKYINLSKYSGWNLSNSFANYQEELAIFKNKINFFSYKGKWVGSFSYSINNKLNFYSNDDKNTFIEAVNSFYSSLISSYLKKHNKNYFIEDSTWNILNIDSLNKVFPNSKFIHVYRDPRDVIASFLKQSWMPSDIEKATLIYKNLMKEILRQSSKNDNCYQLCFEDLLQDKNRELVKLCNFLDLDLSDEMRNFDLKKSNSGRYLVDFNEKEIEYLNNSLSSELEFLRYV